jgi:sugar-specific transcriptional regulator TrmB
MLGDKEKIDATLKEIGLSSKEGAVYLSLLMLGPSAIRKIAEHAGVNRGTTYEALKELRRLGLVSYYRKEAREHFFAEDPKMLTSILQHRRESLEGLGKDVESIIPQLRLLPGVGGAGPAVKYYEDYSGIRSILEDALDSVQKLPVKEYAVFSSAAIRPYLYHKKAFENFTEERIKRKIGVRVIAIGSGGMTQGKDERRWLTTKESAPTYTLMYAGKVAMISVGKYGILHGLIIEDAGIYATQLMLFNALWESLKSAQ